MRKPRSPQRTLGLVVAIATVLFAAAAPTSGAEPTVAAPLGFGMPISAIGHQAAAGVKPDYGSIWVGSWTLSSGWSHLEASLAKAYAANVTPMVQFYYWGDDISISCLENGCDSGLHGARKDQAGWQALAQGLADRLDAQMKGRRAVIVLETEFNKGSVATYEPLDGYLAQKAAFFHERYPASVVVLGFGNWASEHWGTWDRAVAASDMTGLQAMRGSTRNGLESYLGVTDRTLAGAHALKSLFGKPVFLCDVALSSYPEPDYLEHQASVLATMFARIEELRAAGVTAIVYREWLDNPRMDLKNYYGEAERHWGLAYSDGQPKPAADVWVQGVLRERARAPSAGEAPATSEAWTLEAESFAVKSAGGAQRDAVASQGTRWNLWSNGHIEHTFEVASDGPTEVRVWARATELGGVGARMVVAVDGTEVYTADVRASSRYAETAGTRHLAAGTHTLRLSFTNDARTSAGDRNLLLDRVAVTGASGSSSLPSAWASTEAEAFAMKTAGGRQGDAAASGGVRWNLWSNGHIAHGVTVPDEGTYEIRVRAAGTTLGGVGPRMVVSWDGAPLGQRDVGRAYADHTFTVLGVTAGEHRVQVTFVNDARSSTEDRNLLLDKVEWRRVA